MRAERQRAIENFVVNLDYMDITINPYFINFHNPAAYDSLSIYYLRAFNLYFTLDEVKPYLDGEGSLKAFLDFKKADSHLRNVNLYKWNFMMKFSKTMTDGNG